MLFIWSFCFENEMLSKNNPCLRGQNQGQGQKMSIFKNDANRPCDMSKDAYWRQKHRDVFEFSLTLIVFEIYGFLIFLHAS